MSFCPKHSTGHNHWNNFSKQKQFQCRSSRYAEWKFDRPREKTAKFPKHFSSESKIIAQKLNF